MKVLFDFLTLHSTHPTISKSSWLYLQNRVRIWPLSQCPRSYPEPRYQYLLSIGVSFSVSGGQKFGNSWPGQSKCQPRATVSHLKAQLVWELKGLLGSLIWLASHVAFWWETSVSPQWASPEGFLSILALQHGGWLPPLRVSNLGD